jgi:hypothetical protein
MALESKIPGETELKPIKKALKERLLGQGVPFDDADLNLLAEDYYNVSGLGVNEDLEKALVGAYVLGYGRAKNFPDNSH